MGDIGSRQVRFEVLPSSAAVERVERVEPAVVAASSPDHDHDRVDHEHGHVDARAEPARS